MDVGLLLRCRYLKYECRAIIVSACQDFLLFLVEGVAVSISGGLIADQFIEKGELLMNSAAGKFLWIQGLRAQAKRVSLACPTPLLS